MSEEERVAEFFKHTTLLHNQIQIQDLPTLLHQHREQWRQGEEQPKWKEPKASRMGPQILGAFCTFMIFSHRWVVCL